jgi:hypothetical protein
MEGIHVKSGSAEYARQTEHGDCEAEAEVEVVVLGACLAATHVGHCISCRLRKRRAHS